MNRLLFGLALLAILVFNVSASRIQSYSVIQSETGTVQTRLKLYFLFGFFVRSSSMAAYLTDVNGNPIAGQVIAFSFTEAPLRLTSGWLSLGNGVTGADGVAWCNGGFSIPPSFEQAWVFRATYEENMTLSGSKDIVYVTFPSEASIYIRSDGSIDPSNAPIARNGDSYLLTGDIINVGGISIEKSNIALYGAGHMIYPPANFYGEYGIALNGMTNVTIRDVKINSFAIGIDLTDCVNCTIEGNTLLAPEWPAFLYYRWSWWVAVSVMWAINLDRSSNNSISGNTVMNSYAPFVCFTGPSFGDKIYHNNFINSTETQFDTSFGSVEQWDIGYPYGGNFWSDYGGSDNFSGPYQNITGADGIGDVPYVIDENNTDNYPLMEPWQVQNYQLTIASVSGGTTDPTPWTYYYDSPADVSVEAIPSINYELDHWEYQGVTIGSVNPISVHVDGIANLTPVFKLIMLNLTVETSTGGTTNPAPGTYLYASGTNASIRAVPGVGYNFDHWLLDGTPEGSTQPFNFEMTQNCSAEAVFVPAPPPQANFTISPLPPVCDQLVTFDASGSISGSGGFVAYVWDFGEGTNTTTASPIVTYVFTRGGNHNVTLTVLDSDGLNQTVWGIVRVSQHDIAIASISVVIPHSSNKMESSLWVFQGMPVYINVTFMNEGDFDENANATLFYDTTAGETEIGTQNITINAGQNGTASFVWDTAGVQYNQNYTLTANATIPLDISPADNTLSTGPLTVRIMGDMNGDGKIDIKDIALVARSFGSFGPNFLYQGSPSSPGWNLDCDLNGDNKIDVRDLALVARNFGK
ncbi:MAG TPA: PKD domain-containing protein [Candidatus Acidoferrum sp.]|nr:PKD domain-containing protein [Candidatus Acidoferrum sp.]